MLTPLPTGLYIDGVWRPSLSGRTLSARNPYTEQVLAEVAAGDAGDVNAAVQAAARALPGWRNTDAGQRASYLRAIADGVEQHGAALARLQASNSGKPLNEALIDVGDVVATFRYYAGQADLLAQRPDETVALPADDFQASLRRESCGVVGLIVPWNFPMVTTAWKLAPALAAGCTVVLKPSEITPLPELALMAIIADCGLPAGVVNLVNGTGPDVGTALVAHPLLAKISFTGSNAVGRMVMQAAAADVKGVSLELGGKSPILVFADADIDLAVNLVIGGIYFNAGQMCSATSRLLVEDGIAADFVKRLKTAAEALVLGDPQSDATQMGPLVSQAQYRRVLDYIALGLADGATLVTGGVRPAAQPHGHFIEPTIFTDVPHDSAIWREEIFGPVLCVRRFSDEEQAIELANDSEYGLVATVVSASVARAERVAARLEAGMVWINAPQVIFPQTAWGGMKKSSLGRELGPWGLAAFQEIKHIVRASA
ncbi:MAG: aldehyde dehydrogenase family protein [Pseudomonadota bacterium]